MTMLLLPAPYGVRDEPSTLPTTLPSTPAVLRAPAPSPTLPSPPVPSPTLSSPTLPSPATLAAPSPVPCAARPGTQLRHLDGPCECFFGGRPPEFAPSGGAPA